MAALGLAYSSSDSEAGTRERANEDEPQPAAFQSVEQAVDTSPRTGGAGLNLIHLCHRYAPFHVLVGALLVHLHQTA